MDSDTDKKAAHEELVICAHRMQELAQRLKDISADSDAWERKRSEIGLTVADMRNVLTPLVHWLDLYA